MNINWNLLKREHVMRACEVVAKERHRLPSPARGLYVQHGKERLPAKEVARVAYLLATGQPPDTRLKFASGDATLNLLRRLGLEAGRVIETNSSPARDE